MRRVVVGILAAGVSLVGANSAWATFPGQDGRIAYSYEDGIYTVNPDGTDVRFLAKGQSPSWSADGRLLTFERDGPLGGAAVYTMWPDGTHQRRVATGLTPSFSPDRRRVIFVDREGIASARLDGTGYKVLAPGGLRQPEYSPDGTQIVYVNFAPRGIWLMRSDGSNQHAVTQGHDSDPDFRPDGRRIVFHRCAGDDGRHCIDDLVRVVALNGSNISGVRCASIQPTYSPLGNTVAYAKPFGQGPDLDPLGANIWTTRVTPPCAADRPVTHYAQDPGHGFASNPNWQPVPAG